MSPKSEREVIHGRRKRLVPCRTLYVTFTELHEAGAIDFIGVRIEIFIPMDDTAWHGDQRTRRNSDAIGKCEWM